MIYTYKLSYDGQDDYGVSKSLQPFCLKTDAPLRANFRRIKQGGYPRNSYYMKISAEYLYFSRFGFAR